MLDIIDITNGIMTTIFMTFCVATGVRLIHRYFKHDRKEFIYFGIAWLGLVMQHYPVIVSFYGILLTGHALDLFWYCFANCFIPFFVVIGVYAFSEIVYKEHQKRILKYGLILAIINFIAFLYFTLFDRSVLAYLSGAINLRYRLFTLLCLLGMVSVGIFTGIFFYRQTKDANDTQIRAMGILLSMGLFIFMAGEILDAVLPLNIINMVISRFTLISGSASYYFGFFPPKFILRFIKNNRRFFK